MSPVISRSAALFILVCLAGFSPRARGQSSAAVPTQSLYNAYWSTASGFQSLAQLHNNLISAPLTVTPIVYDANGWGVPLDAVNLPPLGNATINIADQLAAKGWTGAPTGSMVFQYQRRFAGALSAELYVENAQESLSFTIPSAEKPPASAVQNAVLWIPSRDAEVYVALQNVSGVSINVNSTLTMSGQAVPLQPVQLPPHGSVFLDISKDSGIGALADAWQGNGVGGITITQDGPPGALNTGGWIEDDHLGYSTTMTFQDPTVGTGRLLSTQILVGPAQALLNLPGPFTISSQLVLRNVSNQPLDFQGELVFSDNNGGVFNATIQTTHLIAGEVRGIDLNQVKAQAGIPESVVSASISLEYSGNSGELMGRVYGVSADKSYGFYWALQPSAGNSYAESFWTTAGSWTPILTVANVAAVPDNVTVELTSNNGTFTLAPFPLQPLESRTINVRDLVTSGAKDKDGKSLPPGTDFGGYRIYGASQESRLLVKEHLIDTASGLSTPFYGVYIYALSIFFIPTDGPISWDPLSNAPYIIDVSGNPLGLSLLINWSDNDYGSDVGGVCPSSFDVYSGSTNINGPSADCSNVISGTQVGFASIAADACCGYINDREGDTGDVPSSNSAEVTITPSIAWNGNYITNTDANSTIQSAVVGEQMFLNGSPSGGTWSVGATAIGGFDFGSGNPPTSGQVGTLFVTSDPNVLFYWIDGGTKTVTYTVSGIAGSVSFSVAAPQGSMSATALSAHAFAIDTYCGFLCVHYGPSGPSGGVQFQNNFTAPDNGSFQWWQTGSSTNSLTNASGGVQSLTCSNELDTNLPYDTANPTNDSPYNSLSVGYSDRVESDSLTMTLMYKSAQSPSIFVPIASVTWPFGYETSSSDGGHTWSFVSKTPAGTLNPSATTTFPSWNGNLNTCHF